MTDHEDITRMKSSLRLKERATRRAMTPELRQSAAEGVAQVVLGLPELREAHAVGAYGAMPEEVDADPLIQELWSRGVRVALPRVVDKLSISWHWYERGYPLCRGAFGLREPCEDAPVASIEEIDCFRRPWCRVRSRLSTAGHGGRVLRPAHRLFAGLGSCDRSRLRGTGRRQRTLLGPRPIRTYRVHAEQRVPA